MIYPINTKTKAIVSVSISNARPIGPLGEKLLTNVIIKFQIDSNPMETKLFKLSPKVN